MNTSNVSGFPKVAMQNNLSQPVAQWIKRTIDVSVAGLGLLFLAPFLGLLVAAIRLDSSGPAFYWHPRIGLGGKTFKMLKFRTMHIDAHAVLWEHLLKDPRLMAEWEQYQKLKHDPRVTRVGRFLRRLSLDELPQLLNVFNGTMSLVGLRPLTLEQRPLCGDYLKEYILIVPGITGLWQVSGRNEIPFKERMAYDRQYMREWSLWLDLWIFLKTFWVVLSGRGC